MKTAFRAVLVLGLLTLGTPGASADDRDVNWRCGWAIMATPLDNMEGPEGHVYATAVTTSDASGTFHCEIRHYGWPSVYTSPLPGRHVFASTGHAYEYQVEPPDGREVCAHIDWDDGHAPFEECRPAPPGSVFDPVVDQLNHTVFDPIDPTLCAVLVSQAPGIPGLVDIDPTGDTAVADVPVWDCPPYAT